MDTPYAPPVVCPRLIGREAHLAALDRALEQAQAGAGRTIVISGEAGIGKSRLLAELTTHTHGQNMLVLRGACFETDRALPYAPLLDLLHVLAAESPAARGEVAGGDIGELRALLPDPAAHLPNVLCTPVIDPAAAQARCFAALVRLVGHLAEMRPLLVVVEDLHWSDETSLDFLLMLARRVVSLPILLLLTFRSDDVNPELRHLLAQLDRERLAAEMRLAPLTRGEVDLMLGAIFDLQRPARAEFRDGIYTLTEGNPFFIEELLKSLTAAGEVFYADPWRDPVPLLGRHIPRTVQDAIQRRVGRLSAAAHELLVVAAVAGRRFDVSVLQAILGCDEAGLVARIRELIAAQLVVEESADQFHFRHALTQQAVYGALLARERRTLHRAVAETLERWSSPDAEANVADLAHHFFEAGAWLKAQAYARRAGERALALYTPRAAVALFTRALEAAHLGDLASALEVYRARGLAYETIGDFASARADHEMALRLAEATGEREAAWQALVDLGALWSARDFGQAEGYLKRALGLAREMRQPATLAASLNRLGNWYTNAEQPLDAVRYHQEALSIVQDLDDPRSRAETLDLLGTAKGLGGDLMQAVVYIRQAAELFRELDDRRGLVSMLASLEIDAGYYLHEAVVCAGLDPADVGRDGELALGMARRIDWPAGEAMTHVFLAFALGTRGHYARALEHAGTGLALAEEIAHRPWMAGAYLALGGLCLDLFAIPCAIRHLENALAMAQESRSHVFARYAAAKLASACVGHRELDRAQTLLDAAMGEDRPMQTLAQRQCWLVRAELAVARGDGGRALEIVDRLNASAANLAAERVIPHVAVLRGVTLARLGRGPEAAASLRAARAEAGAGGLRPLLWRIDVELGHLYRAQGRPADAVAAFDSAWLLVTELSRDVPDDALREDFLCGAAARLPRQRVPSPRQLATAAHDGLTAREREVAVLAARGLTNRQIASTLVISEGTAAVHVKHILGKLGARSRAQIAGWVAQKELDRVPPGVAKHEKDT